MRLLHTSDWHLGRTLHGVDLLGHQAAFVDHLVGLVREADVDVVVVSGDVYDRAVPPVEAVALLTEALARLAEHTTVVVTPGNHDSAVRLGFAASLLREGVHVRTRVADVGRAVELRDEHGPVVVHALPYLDPDSVRRALSEEVQEDGSPRLLPRSHEAVTAAAMRRVRADLGSRTGPRPRSVVMAHAFVVGGAASESERDIRVGGVDAVPAGVFDGVDYVALGHLHGPQRLRTRGPSAPVLQYSGSPLAYSFSEMRHRKGSVLVTLGPDGVQGEPELVPAPVPRRLSEVTGTLTDLLADHGEPHVQDWARVVVTDEVRPGELHARVRARFPHALVVEHRPAGQARRATAGVLTAARDPLDVVDDFVTHVTGTAPTVEEAGALRTAYEAVLAGERSA